MVIVVMVIVVMVIVVMGDSGDGDSTIDGVYYLGLAASFPPSNLVPNCPNGCSKFTLLLPT